MSLCIIRLLVRCALYITGTTTVSEMVPTIALGSVKAQGSKAKSASQVRAAQSNQSEGRRDTKGGQQLVHPVPHQGDPASSRFILSHDWEVSFVPFMWADIEPSGLSTRIARERHVNHLARI
jgi:hypothetical protein